VGCTRSWSFPWDSDDPIVESGNPEFDAAVVVQSYDTVAVHHWLSDPAVRNNILSLFQQHNIVPVFTGYRDLGGVLSAELPTNKPLLPPTTDAAGITSALCALAASAESMPTWEKTLKQAGS